MTRDTDEQTVGEQLARSSGVPVEVSDSHRNWIAQGLPEASVRTVYQVEIPMKDTVILVTGAPRAYRARLLPRWPVRDRKSGADAGAPIAWRPQQMGNSASTPPSDRTHPARGWALSVLKDRVWPAAAPAPVRPTAKEVAAAIQAHPHMASAAAAVLSETA
ncbi:hypothetical protein [Streptomyces sp. NPDC059816]|uniref:hypothetical protein n=1 Tax=Streptomyces sp. NPDC059816 TaxID=3346960 RepID=UPI003657E7CF